MEPRGLYREQNGWAENEHSARVKYDEHQEVDVSERLYRAKGYQPPFDELPWLDEIATNLRRAMCDVCIRTLGELKENRERLAG
jgi:ppGpp synthetase/RelA/SpoT-type nucleotidyltranferase